jgi:filamentous hemagglutinin
MVMTTIKATMGRPQGDVAISTVRTLALAIALATLGIPVVSWAQQVPDAAAGAHRPKMDSAANGVPVVDIVAPKAKGVSHNKYQRFDVDQRGVILNNSASIVQTQLGGYIAGNDNLKGGAASLILNEETSVYVWSKFTGGRHDRFVDGVQIQEHARISPHNQVRGWPARPRRPHP